MENKIYTTERLIIKALDKFSAQSVLDYYLRNRPFLEKWEPVRQLKNVSILHLTTTDCTGLKLT